MMSDSPQQKSSGKKSFIANEHNKKIEKSLSSSIKEGILNAASNSIFTTFIIPLALELRATNLQVGLLNTAQNVASTAGQIPGARMTQYYNRKTIWLLCQLVAKVGVWIPIILLPFLNLQDPVTWLVVFAAISSFFLAMRGPAWTSLMGDLVPMGSRGKYFGKRNMITGSAGIVITLISGFMLAAFGFSVIFAVGLALSAVSIPVFMRMYEPPARKVFHYRHSFAFNPKEWGTSLRLNMNLVIFTLYMTVFNFAVEIASPFYIVFMLRDLGIGYEAFAVVTIVGALSRIISYRYWGRFSDRFGSRKILMVTGVLACFTPFGWMLVSGVWQILLLKLFDGFAWAGFDQVVFNYLLDVTPAQKRPQYIANHNVFAGMGVILGAVVGGLLAESLQGSAFLWFAGLQIVFLASFVLRLAASVLLVKIREAGASQSDILPVRYVFWRTMAVEPANGLKNVISFTFRSSYDRDAEYMKAIRKRRAQESREKKKSEIIQGTAAALENKKTGDNSKTQSQ